MSLFTSFSWNRRPQGECLMKNGAMLLEELIKFFNGRYNPMHIFSKDELQKASNNYDKDRIVFIDVAYSLYMGIHANCPILIKKMVEDEDDDDYIEHCIREIAIASQINNHSKVLKIVGCCLETKIPTLVFEYAQNGNLSNYIYVEDELSTSQIQLLWEHRLRIAIEVGIAIAYLHMAKSQPIIHRHIKTENILIDDNFGAKLFDFGLSLPIPSGKTYVKAEVEGTLGFIAPESIATCLFTEKSDVFAFGAVLLELLTGRAADDVFKEFSNLSGYVSRNRIDQDVSEEITSQNTFVLYLKANLLKEGLVEQLLGCAELGGQS